MSWITVEGVDPTEEVKLFGSSQFQTTPKQVKVDLRTRSSDPMKLIHLLYVAHQAERPERRLTRALRH